MATEAEQADTLWSEVEETREVYNVARLEGRDAIAAKTLCAQMSDLSEEYYCAGWLIGLEFSLWSMLEGGSRNFGMSVVTEKEIGELRSLHKRCDGWWVWSEDLQGEAFVSTEEWIVIYAEHVRK